MKKLLNWRSVGIWLLSFTTAVTSSCKQDDKPSSQATVAVTEVAEAQSAKSKVAGIVFVGKENACECTRTRIDESWAALQQALGDRKHISIEQLQVDTDQKKVAKYQEMRAIMVIPAVYFMDASGALVDVLQGEITAEQVLGMLRSKS